MATQSPPLSVTIPGTTDYTWRDALFSNKAVEIGEEHAQYNIPQEVYDNEVLLFSNVIQNIHDNFGEVTINSSYRSPVVNSAVGSSSGSWHLKGAAADIVAHTPRSNKLLFEYIRDNLQFRELIWEGGTAYPNGNPSWVHVAFVNGRNDKIIKKMQNGVVTVITGTPGANENVIDQRQQVVPAVAGSKTKQKNVAEDTEGNQTEPNFNDLFREIETNLANIELSDTEVSWGYRTNEQENSDWIGLKQYLLYLTSRYMPQSLLPFAELIPKYTVKTESGLEAEKEKFAKDGYIKDGEIPNEVAQKLNDSKKPEDRALLERLRLLTELPPGFEDKRFNLGAKATNDAQGLADLFALDPFQESNKSIDELSESGKRIYAERNVGVRVYGQLIFSPAPLDGVASKPGPIGFQSLEVMAGTQGDNGLARITMKLLDVQGNKFTDVNSPWAFVFDVRPGNIGGDFYFRYGWQIRCPLPGDKDDAIAERYWNHPGWKLFGGDSPGSMKKAIQNQLNPTNPVITLTQSLNILGGDFDSRANLFDEGTVYDEVSGRVKVSESNLQDNYIQLSMTNPELSVDKNGSIEATLNFMTSGAITMLIPIEYAVTVRKLMALDKRITLGDLLIAVSTDCGKFNLLALTTEEERLKKEAVYSKTKLDQATSPNRQFNDVFIIGADMGQGIHPDSIILDNIPNKLKKQLTEKNENGATIIRWFRQVLQENECELQSVATGSGAGINSAWVFTTTKKLDQQTPITKTDQEVREDPTAKMLYYLKNVDQDVFSFRFQGSLVENLQVEKTDAPNQMSIRADNAIGNIPTPDSESLESFKKGLNQSTANDRKTALIAIYAQLQNCSIDCLGHPWIGPGRKMFVKGMGMFDGEYLAMSVTHTIVQNKFTSNIKGARIIRTTDKVKQQAKKDAKANGGGYLSTPVVIQKK